MGLWSAILGFGAGYAVGATKGTEPVLHLQDSARDALKQRMGSSGTSATGRVNIRQVKEVMTALPETMTTSATLAEAARAMADGDMGDVLVTEAGSERVVGIVTDRDIAIRAVAEGLDPKTTTVGEIISRDLTTVAPTDTAREAIRRMKAANVRRLPVVQDGRPIGIVSMGDLSQEVDVGPALADISLAPPDR